MSLDMTGALSHHSGRAPRVVREHEILRVAGWFTGDDREAVAYQVSREVLGWAQRRVGQRLPSDAWGGESFEMPLPGRDPAAIRLRAGNSDLWALRVHDPDKSVPGRAWTIEVVLGHRSGEPVQFGTRLLVATPEEGLSVEPAVPGFVRQIANKFGLMVGSQAVSASPAIFTDSDDAEDLIAHLLDLDRLLPTIVLTAMDGTSAPAIDAIELAGALTGLAHVAVTQSDAAWRLTEVLGKRLSVFGGAARVYQAAFGHSSDPFSHPLILAGQLDSVDRVGRVTQWFRETAAQASLRRTRLGRDVLTFSAVRAARLEMQQSRLRAAGASEADLLNASLKQVEGLKAEIQDLRSEQEYYIDEFGKERERADAAELQARVMALRIQHLTDQLTSKGNDPDSELVFPADWSEFAAWCEQNLTGRVVLTASASRGTRKPQFGDVAIAARCLLWLATEGRERFANGGGALANVSIFSGVQNAPCGADEFDFDWSGRRISCDWHIKNGGNTRDPVRCLRIYYCFDHETQQIIVADMPAHRRSGAT